MSSKPIAITELPPSPDDERHWRMIKYAIAMGIRLVCIALCIVVPGWWLLIPAFGAIALPYFAVVVANNVSRRTVTRVSRPGSVVRVSPDDRQGPREDAA